MEKLACSERSYDEDGHVVSVGREQDVLGEGGHVLAADAVHEREVAEHADDGVGHDCESRAVAHHLLHRGVVAAFQFQVDRRDVHLVHVREDYQGHRTHHAVERQDEQLRLFEVSSGVFHYPAVQEEHKHHCHHKVDRTEYAEQRRESEGVDRPGDRQWEQDQQLE